MSGIAGAVKHVVNDHSEPSCIKCGRVAGDIGRHGKKLGCLPIMRAVQGIGVVAWCSRQCADEWDAVERKIVPKLLAVVGKRNGQL